MPAHAKVQKLIADEEIRLPLSPLRRGLHGYHHDICNLLASQFNREVDKEAIARRLEPLLDGTVSALSHAITSRVDLNLNTSASGEELAHKNPDQLRLLPGIDQSLADQMFVKRQELLLQGKVAGVEVYERTLNLSELEELLKQQRVGLVSLDWSQISQDTEVNKNFNPDKNKHLSDPTEKGHPYFYPVIPIVGFNKTHVFVAVYGQPFLAIPKQLFESARSSSRAEHISIFVSMADLATVAHETEDPLPINSDALLQEYKIAERIERRTKLLTENDELPEGGVKNTPSEFIEACRHFGLSHQSVREVFHFVFTEGKSKNFYTFEDLDTLVKQAEFIGVTVDEFTKFLKDLINAVRRRNSQSSSENGPNFEMLRDFEKLFKNCVETVANYKGPGSFQLGSILRYKLMDLKALPGPQGISREEVRKYPKKSYPVPFVIPDLKNLADMQFDYIRKPRPGEPECVTNTRVMLEMLEKQAGSAFRDCISQALGKGTIRLGSVDIDIFTTPLSKLSKALQERDDKIRSSIPFFINALCQNHGLGAWEMLAAFDAYVDTCGEYPEMGRSNNFPTISREDIWEFTYVGIDNAMIEANQVPASFAAEISFVKDILPWILAGKVHPEYCRIIKDKFNGSPSHRYDNDTGHEIHNTLHIAAVYVDELRKNESKLSHEMLWKKFDLIGDLVLKEKLEPMLTEALVANDLPTFTDFWRKVLRCIHPDKGSKDAETEFAREFIEYSLDRKKELLAKKRLIAPSNI